jgi:hypothetical protein
LQGTIPFIAMELLLFGVPHRVAHDLESIIYVLLFLVSHLDGPDNSVRDPPLYAGEKSCLHPSAIREWFAPGATLPGLGAAKVAHMTVLFEARILDHISPYFQPISAHIAALWLAVLPKRPEVGIDWRYMCSHVTCMELIDVFKTALLDPNLIDEAKNSELTVLGKRACPGDFITASNGWDVVPVAKKNLEAKAKMHTSRKTKLMTKKRRA